MYDKLGIVLRIETTANDVSFFKHHRKVEQRDGTTVYQLAPLDKSIYSLGDLPQLLLAANRRYLDFISAIDDPSDGNKLVAKISETKTENYRACQGFNFFAAQHQRLFEMLLRGDHNIHGLRNADLRRRLPLNAGQVSRLLKRLRVHRLIKCVGRTHKYYVTALGRRAMLAGLQIRHTLLPRLPTPAASGSASSLVRAVQHVVSVAPSHALTAAPSLALVLVLPSSPEPGPLFLPGSSFQ